MRALRPWREWTLRNRLVVAIAALVAVGLLITDVSGVLLLRRYLTARVDDQLTAAVHRSSRTVVPEPFTRRIPQLGPSTTTLYYYNDGRMVAGPTSAAEPPAATDVRRCSPPKSKAARPHRYHSQPSPARVAAMAHRRTHFGAGLLLTLRISLWSPVAIK